MTHDEAIKAFAKYDFGKSWLVVDHDGNAIIHEQRMHELIARDPDGVTIQAFIAIVISHLLKAIDNDKLARIKIDA